MESKPGSTKLLNSAPPYGHIIINEKWIASNLVQCLKGKYTVYIFL